SWKGGPQAQTFLNQLVQQALNDRGLLAHLILKGNFIWSQSDATLFLDGEVFGQPPAANSSNVPLRLPSGDRRPGVNFDMWFWLVAAPSFITEITANPPGPINLKDQTTITMTLSAPAPPNSMIVLTLSNANLTVPSERASSPPTSPPSFTATVSVATGQTTATVVATAIAAGATTITASFGGQSVALNLAVQNLPVLTGQLVLSPARVFVGGLSTGTLTLSGPAPSNGVIIDLKTNAPHVAGIPATVAVPAGGTTQKFDINGLAAG